MIGIARAERTSTARAEEFFARWCDLGSHPEWAPSMEYFRPQDPFGIGARGVSRPRGGEEASFVVTAVGPGAVYADRTELGGAELTVHHEATPVDGGCVVVLRAWLEGPEADGWSERLGDTVQRALERDLESLALLLEG
ncbi:SRPBCC family protein [Microbacterium cremeum]|uniref:SRPBCC family protein n=1 Tax=Microbacterium cremeum TaxID=2782169 RepID=UPI001887A0E2|nr:SRPBCC family protein [Microbacterium cremeum]